MRYMMILDLDWSAKTCVITLLVSSICLWNIDRLAYNKLIEETQ